VQDEGLDERRKVHHLVSVMSVISEISEITITGSAWLTIGKPGLRQLAPDLTIVSFSREFIDSDQMAEECLALPSAR
jgi:hypothetical protein